MAEIYDISDHKAFLCECGSVSFALLMSGRIECDKCLSIYKGILWGFEDDETDDEGDE